MPQAAAVYTRLSVDRDGDKVGIAIQEAKCRQVTDLKDWPVAKVYTDRGASAGKVTVRRPAFERLKADIKADRVDAVVVYAYSRGFRRLREYLEFMELCDEHGVVFVSATEPIDTSTDIGRLVVNLLVSIAEMEWRVKRQRILDWHDDRAHAGKHTGGGTRAFGFERDGITVHRDEAKLIREAARRVLKGDTLYGICQDWTSRGVLTPAGGTWRTGTLKRFLTSARIAGLREHHGDGPVKATWKAIIDKPTHERVREVLNRRNGTGKAGRRYLLTGIAHCGLCGERLVARPRADKRRAYVCASGPNFKGCGKIRSLAEPLEDLVFGEAYGTWSQPEIQATLAPDVDRAARLSDELARDVAALDRLKHDYYVEGLITDRDEYLALRREVEQRMGKIEVQLDELGRRTRYDWDAWTKRADAFEEKGWEALTPEEFDASREIVDTVVERVVVHPAVRGRNTFDPTRVEIVWRPELAPAPAPPRKRARKAA